MGFQLCGSAESSSKTSHTDGQVYVGTEAPLTEDASGQYYDVAPISEYPTVVALDSEDGDVSWAYAGPPTTEVVNHLYGGPRGHPE